MALSIDGVQLVAYLGDRVAAIKSDGPPACCGPDVPSRCKDVQDAVKRFVDLTLLN